MLPRPLAQCRQSGCCPRWCVLLFLVAGCWCVTGCGGDNSLQPPLLAEGGSTLPFDIKSPGNPGYVGWKACGECHAARVKEFQQTRHFQALVLTEEATLPRGFQAGANIFQPPRAAVRFEMALAPKPTVKVVPQPPGAGPSTAPIDFIYGSGAGTDEVYFTRHDRELFELPVVWLSQQDCWGTSLLNPHVTGDRSRPLSPQCLECHTVWVDYQRGSLNEYGPLEPQLLGVTCERCHGPAETHVAWHRGHPAAKAGTEEPPAEDIVRPNRLSRERLMDLCAQCHTNTVRHRRPPFSYRPGEVLEESFHVLEMKYPEQNRVANQVQGLKESRCYQQTETLTCITCHDPHHVPNRTNPSERGTPTADEAGGASRPSAPGVPQRAKLTSERGTPTADEGGASRPSAPGVPQRAKLTSERGTPTADEEGGASRPSAPGVPERAKLTRERGTPTADEAGGASRPSAPGVPQRTRLASASNQSCKTCHQPQACGARERLPEPVRDQCATCHMPKRNKVQVNFETADGGIKFPAPRYEHRIAIYPEAEREAMHEWHRGQETAESTEQLRQLGHALQDHWRQAGVAAQADQRWIVAIDAYRSALRFGEVDEVRTRLADVTRNYKESNRLWFEGSHQKQTRQLQEAIGTFQSLLELEPKSARVHYELGTLYAAIDRRPLARKHLELAGQLDLNDPGAEVMLGWLDFLEGNPASASKHYQTAQTIEPWSERIEWMLGRCLAKTGRWEESVTAFQRALTIDPHFADAATELRAVLRERLTPAAALPHAVEGVKATLGEDLGLLLALAEIYRDLDRLPEARRTVDFAKKRAREKKSELLTQIEALEASILEIHK